MIEKIKNYFRKPKAAEIWKHKSLLVEVRIIRIAESVVFYVTSKGTVMRDSIKEFKEKYAKLD